MSWQRFLEPPAWESLGGRYPVMPMGRCFINAYRLTRCFPELRYVEGEAEPFFDPNAAEPGPHAWCVTSEGIVVDATWKNDACWYAGVVSDRETINRVALETGF